MDRLFDVDGHGPKKSRILDQPDEKIQFEIFDKLSWPQLLTNFYEILTSCLPSYGVKNLLTAFSVVAHTDPENPFLCVSTTTYSHN